MAATDVSNTLQPALQASDLDQVKVLHILDGYRKGEDVDIEKRILARQAIQCAKQAALRKAEDTEKKICGRRCGSRKNSEKCHRDGKGR